MSVNGGAELVSRDGGGAGVGEGKTGAHAWKRGSWYQEERGRGKVSVN